MTILIGTDFSENSRGALRLGVRLGKLRDEEVVLVHVVDLAADDNAWRVLVESPEDLERSARMEARQELEAMVQEVLSEEEHQGLQVKVLLGNPIDELLEVADEYEEVLFVCGTRGKNRLQQFFLGSTAHRLVRRLKDAAILVPPAEELDPGAWEKIAVAMDFSAASRDALRHAYGMAEQVGATLHVLHGVVLPEVTAFEATVTSTMPSLQELLKERHGQITKILAEEGIEGQDVVVEVLTGSPAPMLREYVEREGVDLLVMGTHGRRGWSRLFLGNTAERLLRRTPCPLYLVRGSAKAKAE